ncbi:MAG: hypothetical protein JSW00_13095 [Thermoplasmata archaeon]|nr:MAG: hypothetical protein JSW00_13095 [Thermoplasmata archaeon]
MRIKDILVILVCLCAIFGCGLTYSNTEAEITTNSKLTVINTGIEGRSPIIDGNIIAFTHDFRGSSPWWIYYHDISTGTSVNTSIMGRHISLEVPYIVIYSYEFWIGDYNGDGDTKDSVFSVYNINTRNNTVFAVNAGMNWDCIDNWKIVYSLYEGRDRVDYNGDGDILDACGFYYDILTHKSTYFHDAYSTKIYGNYIIWDDHYTIWYYNIADDAYSDIGFNESYPDLEINSYTWRMEGDVIFFEVREIGPDGPDINKNDYFYNQFVGYYDIGKDTLRIIITDPSNGLIDIDNGNILLYVCGPPTKYSLYDIETDTIVELHNCSKYTSGWFYPMEGNIIVGNDWDGIWIPEWPDPVGRPNVLIYDVTTDEILNTHIIGFIRDFDGNTIVIVTNEVNADLDLNGDGDTRDSIVRYIIAEPEETPCEGIIDIDPDTLNLKSKGRWITAYINLNSPYDVNDIDISTVILEDTIPAEWGDIQNNTLMVKFDRSEVENMLSPGTYNLKVTGELMDGTAFEGYSDEIRVIEPP